MAVRKGGSYVCTIKQIHTKCGERYFPRPVSLICSRRENTQVSSRGGTPNELPKDATKLMFRDGSLLLIYEIMKSYQYINKCDMKNQNPPRTKKVTEFFKNKKIQAVHWHGTPLNFTRWNLYGTNWQKIFGNEMWRKHEPISSVIQIWFADKVIIKNMFSISEVDTRED